MEKKLTANILRIIRGTTVDGPGFRTSIYFAGCEHHCPGCHNPESWDFSVGTAYTVEELIRIIEEEDFDVTLSGGDPLYSPVFVAELSKEIKKLHHSIWVYTGFKWEELLNTAELTDVLKNIDVLVDSPYMLSLRDTDLLFRGSSNQRIIDVQASLHSGGSPVLWKE